MTLAAVASLVYHVAVHARVLLEAYLIHAKVSLCTGVAIVTGVAHLADTPTRGVAAAGMTLGAGLARRCRWGRRSVAALSDILGIGKKKAGFAAALITESAQPCRLARARPMTTAVLVLAMAAVRHAKVLSRRPAVKVVGMPEITAGSVESIHAGTVRIAGRANTMRTLRQGQAPPRRQVVPFHPKVAVGTTVAGGAVKSLKARAAGHGAAGGVGGRVTLAALAVPTALAGTVLCMKVVGPARRAAGSAR
jgi:hypothetical protein